MSRSAAAATPLVAASAISFRRAAARTADRAAGWCLLANLAMPALHVTYTKVVLISCLPLELFRLWKGSF
jgi:hypothetical protein